MPCSFFQNKCGRDIPNTHLFFEFSHGGKKIFPVDLRVESGWAEESLVFYWSVVERRFPCHISELSSELIGHGHDFFDLHRRKESFDRVSSEIGQRWFVQVSFNRSEEHTSELQSLRH